MSQTGGETRDRGERDQRCGRRGNARGAQATRDQSVPEGKRAGGPRRTQPARADGQTRGLGQEVGGVADRAGVHVFSCGGACFIVRWRMLCRAVGA